MSKKWLMRIALFCAMLLVMLGASKLRMGSDSMSQDIALAPGKTVVCTVDLGKEGALKRLLSPNIYALSLRLQPEAKEKLRVVGSGMEMFLSQGSKKGIWTELKPEDELQVKAGKGKNKHGQGKNMARNIPLNVELRVPREALEKHDVAEGTLKFYGEKGEYASVLVKVINSRGQS